MNEAPAVWRLDLYPALWSGDIDLATVVTKMVLLDGTYSYDPTDTGLASISAAVIDTTTLAGVEWDTVDPGILLADDAVWPSPPSGQTVRGGAIYFDVGSGVLAAFYGRRNDNVAINVITDGTEFTWTFPAGQAFRI